MIFFLFIASSLKIRKEFLFAVLLSTLMACAPRTPLPVHPSTPDSLWNSLLSSGDDQFQSFHASLSITYIGEKKRAHLTGQLWGNKNGPVRLDLRAGIGKLVAMIVEKENTWLLYDTLQKTAYQGQSDAVRRELGISFPFSLNILGPVVFGSVKEILPPNYKHATVTEDGETIYSFQNGTNVQTFKVGPTGLPMQFQTEIWQISWPGWETGSIPPRLKIKNDQSTFFLRLKDYATYKKERPLSATELALPPETVIIQR